MEFTHDDLEQARKDPNVQKALHEWYKHQARPCKEGDTLVAKVEGRANLGKRIKYISAKTAKILNLDIYKNHVTNGRWLPAPKTLAQMHKKRHGGVAYSCQPRETAKISCVALKKASPTQWTHVWKRIVVNPAWPAGLVAPVLWATYFLFFYLKSVTYVKR